MHGRLRCRTVVSVKPSHVRLVAIRRLHEQRLGGMLLRHGRVYRDGAAWTMKHAVWLESQRFEDRAVQATYARYRATESVRDADVQAIEADLLPWCRSRALAGVGRWRDPLAQAVRCVAVDELYR